MRLANIHQPQVLFHGTKSSKLRAIIRHGLLGELGDGAGGFDVGSAATHSGVYMTKFLCMAAVYAYEVAEENEERPVIVAAQWSGGEWTPDEDVDKEVGNTEMGNLVVPSSSLTVVGAWKLPSSSMWLRESGLFAGIMQGNYGTPTDKYRLTDQAATEFLDKTARRVYPRA